MKTIPEALWVTWTEHPITKLLQARLNELYSSTADDISRLNIRQPADQVALITASLVGRNRVIEKFIDMNKLKDDILTNVSWEK